MQAHHPADLFAVMHTLMHGLRQRMRAAAQQMQPELTPNEMRALLFIGSKPMRTQKELTEHSGTDKAQIARMLDALQEKGWLERVCHPQDKRSRCLRLSAAGQELFETMRALERSIAEQLLFGFTGAEQQQLRGLLARLLKNLDAAD